MRICSDQLHNTPPAPDHSPLSADCERQGLTLTPLVFLQKLNAVVAVELDGSPVAVVTDQQRALLQAAFTVGLGGDSELGDVLGQVLFDCRALRLRPGTLQNPSLSCKCRENNRVYTCFNHSGMASSGRLLWLQKDVVL